MLNDRRRYKHRRLPVDYDEVEYIENPNKGYIITNFSPEDANCGFEVKVMVPLSDNDTDEFGIFGQFAEWPGNNNRYGTNLYIYYRTKIASGNRVLLYHQRYYTYTDEENFTTTGNIKALSPFGRDGQPHVYRAEIIDYANRFGNKSDNFYADGESCLVSDNYSALPIFEGHEPHYCFFTAPHYKITSYTANVRIYYAKTLDLNNEVSHEFIPAVRQSDNVAGFYDTMTDTFWSSQAEGKPFVAGPLVKP